MASEFECVQARDPGLPADVRKVTIGAYPGGFGNFGRHHAPIPGIGKCVGYQERITPNPQHLVNCPIHPGIRSIPRIQGLDQADSNLGLRQSGRSHRGEKALEALRCSTEGGVLADERIDLLGLYP